jgi:5-methylcytosine-specific restriction endonuclease McrA
MHPTTPRGRTAPRATGSIAPSVARTESNRGAGVSDQPIREITEYQEFKPTPESYWRSAILFGRNSASYKFAFAQSLLEMAAKGKSTVSLGELAEPYARRICEHLKKEPRQSTSRSSRFLGACRAYNEGEIPHDRLVDVTESLGFTNVVDAFQHVNGDDLPVKFYVKDYRTSDKLIVLTDETFKLVEQGEPGDLNAEAEARWRLVETAWGLRAPKSFTDIRVDMEYEHFVLDQGNRRRDLTGTREALNGYQKGNCFYCYDNISVDAASPKACDVDHFFPHVLGEEKFRRAGFPRDVELDGAWNLVLSCKDCNRGPKGKFARVPALKYLERLERRNEFLIASHHPLREALMRQTGPTPPARRSFLRRVYDLAVGLLIHRWEIEPRGPATF